VKEPKGLLFLGLLLMLLIPSIDAVSSIHVSALERPEVQRALKQFLTQERDFVQRGFSNAPVYLPIVREALEERGLPSQLSWLPLIESAFSVRAYSRTGACGIWQFMPQTAKWYNLRIDFWVDERRDPFKSSSSAAQHLKELFYYYKNWELALAAYNAGMGAVDRAVCYGRTRDYWALCKKGLLKRETCYYVPRFYAVCEIAEHPGKYGFDLGDEVGYPEFELLKTNHPVDLSELAKRSGLKKETILFLNPELRRLLTPIGRKYELRVPRERYAEVLSIYHDLPEGMLTGVEAYRVKSGETVSEIAEKFGASVSLITLLNNIYNPRRLIAGRVILVPVPKSVEIEDEAFFPKWGFHTQEISYRIKKGDTLWEIARRYRIDVEAILAINGLSYDSTIQPGDEIALWIETAFCR
jgi:membrane-bound lytic murein transglycosylase D